MIRLPRVIRLPSRRAREALRDSNRAITGMQQARRYHDRVMYDLHSKDCDEALARVEKYLERQRRILLVWAVATAVFCVPFLILNVRDWNDGIAPKVSFATLLIAVAYVARSAWRLYRAGKP